MPGNTLAEIIQSIEDELSYSPDSQNYSDSLARRVQRTYAEIVSAAQWRFNQKTATITLQPTVSGSATARLVLDSSINARLVTVHASYAYVIPAAFTGATFVHPDGTESRIVLVDTANNVLYLDDALGEIDTTNYEDWSVRFDTYDLPHDCEQPIGLMHRGTSGTGRIKHVPRRREERLFLDKATTGSTPRFYVEDDRVPVEPPLVAPSLVATATASTIPAGTYAYRYTILWAGKESTPSPASAELAISGGNLTVQLSGFDEVRWYDSGTAKSSGIERRIYRRDVTNDGPWLWVGDMVSTDTTFDDSAIFGTSADRRKMRRLNVPVSYQTIRAWTTPSETQDWTLRYRFKVPPLVGDTDTVIIPDPYHNLILYRVMSDILSGGEATKFERRYNDLYEQCKDKYLHHEDAVYKTESWLTELYDNTTPDLIDRQLGTPSVS